MASLSRVTGPAREIALLTNPTSGKGKGARARDAAADPDRDWRSIMDKPLWIDPKLSSWDREIIQLADIVVFAASRYLATGAPLVGPQFLWHLVGPAIERR